LASTISALTFTSFQQIAPDEQSFQTMMDDLDQWINGNSTGFPTGTISPLQKKQYDIQKRWINQYQSPGMEFVMIPMGGLTRTVPANATSYMIVAAILQHPVARGSVVRVIPRLFGQYFLSIHSDLEKQLLILFFLLTFSLLHTFASQN
jgi:hypothetical protein